MPRRYSKLALNCSKGIPKRQPFSRSDEGEGGWGGSGHHHANAMTAAELSESRLEATWLVMKKQNRKGIARFKPAPSAPHHKKTSTPLGAQECDTTQTAEPFFFEGERGGIYQQLAA